MNEATKTQTRSKRIELIITPGRSLGPFRLGSSLWDTIHFLSDRPQFFPSVELKYSQEKPLEYDFIIALPTNGLNLRYDGSLQRLKSIECYDPNKVKLIYQNSDVSSSKTIPTFLLIYKSFGPTYPGEFDSNQSIYTLKYPGLAFTFPIPAKHQNLYASSTDLPLEFPDGTTPIASKLILYSQSNTWQQAAVPPLPKVIAEFNNNNSIKYGKLGKREVETVIVKPTIGITLAFPTFTSTVSAEANDAKKPSSLPTTYQHVMIKLNTTSVQDILADLGKPSRLFYKEEDKMKIHSISDNMKPANQLSNPMDTKALNNVVEDKEKDPSVVQPTDYFLNYFYLGIDILIDGVLHVCKKIVLHGNIPGHFDFQRYKRCPFQINFPKGKSKPLVDVEDDNENTIASDITISEMQEHIPWEASSGHGDRKPVILTRGSSEQNPFGSTHLTGYDEGLVMEVMKNGYVPTVVLF